jgi:hypothetical protein
MAFPKNTTEKMGISPQHKDESSKRCRDHFMRMSNFYGRPLSIIDLRQEDVKLREAVDHGYREAGIFENMHYDYHFIKCQLEQQPDQNPSFLNHWLVPKNVSDLAQSAVSNISQFTQSKPALSEIFTPPSLERKDFLQVVADSYPRQQYFCNRRNLDTSTSPIDTLQRGVYRVCDFECVDEGNTAQYLLCVLTVRKMMMELEPGIGVHCLMEIETALGNLWVGLGNSIAQYYVGTDSLSTFDIKKSLIPIHPMQKAGIHLERLYFRYFLEAERQDGIQILLGNYINFTSVKDISAHTDFSRRVYARDLYSSPWLIRILLIYL